jgi:radical SAM protein with 4Fe4S-binding SPASM domain
VRAVRERARADGLGYPEEPFRLLEEDSRKVSRFLSREGDPVSLLSSLLGEPFDLYRKKWEEARAFKLVPPFPLHVDYELLYGCNLRCPMCLLSLSPQKRASFGQEGDKLPLAKVKSLIDEGAENGQASIGFGGLWEPLLSPHIAEIVSYAREKGLVEAMFNTNGYYLSPERSRELMEAGLTRIMISLDAASSETYRQMRPGSDLGRVEENIRALLALRKKQGRKLPVVRLSFCLTKINQAELGPFLEKWSGEADFFSLQRYGHYGEGTPGLFPDDAPGPMPTGRCAAPQKRLLVRHDGTVIPCCDVSGLNMPIGNVWSESLLDIWQSQGLKDIRRSLEEGVANPMALPKACHGCQNKYR